VFFDLPITGSAALETAVRAHFSDLLPDYYLKDDEARTRHLQERQQGSIDHQLVAIAGECMRMVQNAAGSGKLRAAAAATGLLQLAPRLYCLLVTSCKCYSATVGRAQRIMFIDSEDGGYNLWLGIRDANQLLIGVMNSMHILALPADAAGADAAVQTNSSSVCGSSGASLAARLGAGLAPWLHLVGRALLLLAQLLVLLPQEGCIFLAEHPGFSCLNITQSWSIAEALQESLQGLLLPGLSAADAAKVSWV
jgi:hypothetical protein